MDTWPFVWGAYGLTAATLLGYAVILTMRSRR
jgi:hypothetical protein